MPRRRRHRAVFLAAGIYNLAWGTATALDPQWVFRLTGMEPLNHPGVFACLGMVIGLYGVVYLEVARVPERGFVAAAVGLAGKVLGPIGMVVGIARGEWPVAALAVCVTNDLVWWIPFARYLRDAWPEFRRPVAPEWRVFGEPGPEPRAPRPGAYAVLFDARGRVAIVIDGGYVGLPGGGTEPGESPEEALRREVLEECGFEVRVGPVLGRAYQHLPVKPFCKQAVFYRAFACGGPVRPGEHEVRWVRPEEADFFEESHAWAVGLAQDL